MLLSHQIYVNQPAQLTEYSKSYNYFYSKTRAGRKRDSRNATETLSTRHEIPIKHHISYKLILDLGQHLGALLIRDQTLKVIILYWQDIDCWQLLLLLMLIVAVEKACIQ